MNRTKRFRRNRGNAGQNNPGITAGGQHQLVMKFINPNIPNPVRVFHPSNNWFISASYIPEFHVPVISASRQYILFIHIKIQVSKKLFLLLKIKSENFKL